MRYAIHFIIYLFVSTSVLIGQDIHYSQFFNSPLNLNPALTGVYNGDARVHANYRSQWSGVPVGYTSADLGADLKHRFKKGHYLGYGALVNYDRAGDLNLGWNSINGFLSLSLKLGEKGFITPGLTVGYNQRGFDQNNVTTGNQWNGKGVGPTAGAENIGVDQLNYVDVGVGLNYRWQKAYRKHLDIGGSLSHINKPNQLFQGTDSLSMARPQKLNLYAMLNYPLLDDLDILINGLYSNQTPYREIVINAQGKIYLSKAKDKALYLGAGYRFEDAWYPMIGIQLGQFYGAFSYDLNLSPWDVASNGNGGPELSLRYIWSKLESIKYQPCLIF